MSGANENRPPGVSLRAASGRCLHLYPEATPAARAVLSGKHESMPTCLSPRWLRVPGHRFTVRFLSSLLFRVRSHAESGNGIYGRILPGRLVRRVRRWGATIPFRKVERVRWPSGTSDQRAVRWLTAGRSLIPRVRRGTSAPLSP
jgi:hypothetical protein